MIKRLSPMNRF